MEKPIIKDEAFLAQKSQPATFMDIAVAQDLLDTLAPLRGLGSKYDRRAEMRYRRQYRSYEYCYAEPGDYQALRQIYDGGGLPVAGGRACCSALRKNYGGLSGHAV